MNSVVHSRYALYKPPTELYALNRKRLATQLPGGAKSAAVVQGASETPLHDTDVTATCVLRQDAWFKYLVGYDEADCFIAVIGASAAGKDDSVSILFVPRLDPAYAVWLGALPLLEDIKKQTGVDAVHYADAMADVLKGRGVEHIHVLVGVNSDSKLAAKTASFAGMSSDFKVEGASSSAIAGQSSLFNIMSNLRSTKTAHELALIARVVELSSRAHIHVMQNVKPGWSQNQVEATFKHFVYFHGGCRFCSYTCICATGHECSVLHYPNNDLFIEDGSLALLDMGAEMNGYASDITCSFPVNGRFTDKQKSIYNAVLDAQQAVFRKMKPGVLWIDMHKLALRVMSTHLRRIGIITCDEDTAEAAELMYTFQPHGLGHQLGLAVHDVGNYGTDDPAQNPRPTDRLCCRLRTARTLTPGLVMTVEPGCYFNTTLLEAALANEKLKPLLNEELLRKEFWGLGGVRIEDDVVVTASGVRNLTKCPRTVEDIEAVMAGKPWVPQENEEYAN